MLEVLFFNQNQVVEEIVMHEDKTPFTMQKRRGLIVWVYSLRQLKNLRRFGFVHYVSRKMKYVVMYLNEEEYESKKTKKSQNGTFLTNLLFSCKPIRFYKCVPQFLNHRKNLLYRLDFFFAGIFKRAYFRSFK